MKLSGKIHLFLSCPWAQTCRLLESEIREGHGCSRIERHPKETSSDLCHSVTWNRFKWSECFLMTFGHVRMFKAFVLVLLFFWRGYWVMTESWTQLEEVEAWSAFLQSPAVAHARVARGHVVHSSLGPVFDGWRRLMSNICMCCFS